MVLAEPTEAPDRVRSDLDVTAPRASRDPLEEMLCYSQDTGV